MLLKTNLSDFFVFFSPNKCVTSRSGRTHSLKPTKASKSCLCGGLCWVTSPSDVTAPPGCAEVHFIVREGAAHQQVGEQAALRGHTLANQATRHGGNRAGGRGLLVVDGVPGEGIGGEPQLHAQLRLLLQQHLHLLQEPKHKDREAAQRNKALRGQEQGTNYILYSAFHWRGLV